MAEELGDTLSSRLREMLLRAYPVRWKLDSIASWAEENLTGTSDRGKELVRSLHQAADPFVRKSRWRTEVVSLSLKVLKMHRIDKDSPAPPSVVHNSTPALQPVTTSTPMPLLPKHLRGNPLQILLYRPLELHDPEVLRLVADHASNPVICRAANTLHHIGYVDGECSQNTVNESVEKAVRDHIETSISEARHGTQQVIRNKFQYWVAGRRYLLDGEFKNGFPYESSNGRVRSNFLQRFRVNQHLISIYRHARQRGAVLESIEFLDNLDLTSLGLDSDQQRVFAGSRDLDEKLGVLFEHFHTVVEALSLKASPVRHLVEKRGWLAKDAAKVVDCAKCRIDMLTHPGPKGTSSKQQRASALEAGSAGQPAQQQKRKRDQQNESPGEASECRSWEGTRQ